MVRIAGVTAALVLTGCSQTAPNPPRPDDNAPRIRVGSTFGPKLIRHVRPKYPAAAKTAKVEGTVRFDATIAKDGTIRDLQLVNGHPLLVDAAREAIKDWRYEPPMLYGEPVEVKTAIDLSFSLRQ